MIKFPKVHIATSVVNRILEVADGVAYVNAPAPTEPRAPVTPVASAPIQGAILDQKLAQGTPDVGTVENAPDPGATLAGDPLMQTFLTPGRG